MGFLHWVLENAGALFAPKSIADKTVSFRQYLMIELIVMI